MDMYTRAWDSQRKRHLDNAKRELRFAQDALSRISMDREPGSAALHIRQVLSALADLSIAITAVNLLDEMRFVIEEETGNDG